MYVTFIPVRSRLKTSCLGATGTAAAGVAAGAGTARAGYRDRLPRFIPGKGGKSRQLALCRMLAAGT